MAPALLDGSGVSDEDAFALINALQVNPRASWASVGRVLQIDPATAARRWQRLTAAGEAWVAAYPLRTPRRMTALIELRCVAARTFEIAESLAQDPQCMNIDITTGGRELILTLITRSATEMSEYVLRRFSGLDGVLGINTRLEFKQFADGSDWRAPTPAERDILALSPEHAVRPATPPTTQDWAIAAALGRDGRLSTSELAQLTGLSETTVRRRLNLLLGNGQLRLRCDLARGRSQTPVGVWLFLRVAADGLDAFGRAIAQHPYIRFVGSVDGASNLMAQAWVPEPGEVPALEAQLAKLSRTGQVVDRCVILHSVKRVGRILDQHGRARRTASTDLREPPSWTGSPPLPWLIGDDPSDPARS
ncbi:Lrp/AsnC family transcriptional regulator [Nocardioides insulae]|uniref:Lrp/AsnC family transcriptional regulator n=1 Tax=Nocardioides insulae TaxID=394734 RepID=UPI000686591A|nr:AsnC family transcriptional regulator [Nocardioides insulae]